MRTYAHRHRHICKGRQTCMYKHNAQTQSHTHSHHSHAHEVQAMRRLLHCIIVRALAMPSLQQVTTCSHSFGVLGEETSYDAKQTKFEPVSCSGLPSNRQTRVSTGNFVVASSPEESASEEQMGHPQQGPVSMPATRVLRSSMPAHVRMYASAGSSKTTGLSCPGFSPSPIACRWLMAAQKPVHGEGSRRHRHRLAIAAHKWKSHHKGQSPACCAV